MESASDQAAKVDVGYEIPTWNNWSPLAKFYHPLQAGSIDGTDTAPHDKAVTRAMETKCKFEDNTNTRSWRYPQIPLFISCILPFNSPIISKCVILVLKMPAKFDFFKHNPLIETTNNICIVKQFEPGSVSTSYSVIIEKISVFMQLLSY